MAYKQLFRQMRQAICVWLQSGNDMYRPFEVSFSHEIGYGMKREESTTSPRYKAKFVFTKSFKGPRVFTAYPKGE